MRDARKIALAVLGLLCLPVFCFASQISEEEVTPRTRKITLDEEAEKPFFERGKLKNLVAVSVGYDSNTHLDSRRLGDAFIQAFFKTTFTSPLSKKTDGILEYGFMNLDYTDESNLNLINNSFHAGLNTKINKDLLFSCGYYLDWLEYLNTGSDDFANNRIDLKLRQNLPLKMYHSLGYELSYKN